jgi:hypothetical protein
MCVCVFVYLLSWKLSHGNEWAHIVIDDDDDDVELVLKRVMVMMLNDDDYQLRFLLSRAIQSSYFSEETSKSKFILQFSE